MILGKLQRAHTTLGDLFSLTYVGGIKKARAICLSMVGTFKCLSIGIGRKNGENGSEDLIQFSLIK